MYQTTLCATEYPHINLERIGEVLLNAVATAQLLGHKSPVDSLPYLGTTDIETQVVRDVFLTCSHSGDKDASARLATLIEDMGYVDLIAEAVTR